jgi:hypothetical protein
MRRPRPALACCYKEEEKKLQTRTGHKVPAVEKWYNSTLSLNSEIDKVGVVSATPRLLYPRQKDPVPIIQVQEGAPQGRSRRVRKISFSALFDSEID